MTTTSPFQIKRVYEPVSPADGARYLVDRLWPRGLNKTSLMLTAWLTEVTPSPSLRREYHRHVVLWPEFQQRYRDELQAKPSVLLTLMDGASAGPVTLLYASRDLECNHAVVLKAFLDSQWAAQATQRPTT